MKTRTIATVSAALALSACLPAVLWTSNIEDAALTGPALSVVAQDNHLYQLYPVGTQLHLRKLDSKGALLWQVPVDETLENSIDGPRLRVSAAGPVVAFQDKAARTAFLKGFDADGNSLWSADLGDHASETLNDLAVTTDGHVSLALRYTGTTASVFRFDSSGQQLWEHPLATCPIGTCVTSLAVDEQGNTLAANADFATSRLTLIDSSGAQLWYRSRGTGISTAGLVPNKLTATASGFAILHPFTSFHYNYAGTQDWSYGSGSNANIVQDDTGNFYIPGPDKISKLDSTGTLLSEINLADQKLIRQLQWREDLQRLVVLTNYENVGPEIDGTITAKSGSALSLYDAEGVRKARYNSKAAMTKSSLCTPYPQCTTVSYTPGETWSQFSTTLDRKLVVSGIVTDSARFAKAYKLP